MKFGEVSELIRDESVAMRVDLTDTRGLGDALLAAGGAGQYTPQGLQGVGGAEGSAPQPAVDAGGDGRPAARRRRWWGTWTFTWSPGSAAPAAAGTFSRLRLRDRVPLQTSTSHGLSGAADGADDDDGLQLGVSSWRHLTGGRAVSRAAAGGGGGAGGAEQRRSADEPAGAAGRGEQAALRQ